MEIIFFPIALIFSFFILYSLSKNDFIFLRKNITLHKIFDTFILSLMGFFILGRILYVFGGLHHELYNPIAVLHVLRYPGILYIGGVVGLGMVVLFKFGKRRVIPHILDVFSLALYPLFLLMFFFSSFQGNFLYFNISIFVLSLLFFLFGLYSHKNILLKDGSLALLFVCLVCVFTIVNEFSTGNRFFFTFSIPQILSLVIFVTCAVTLLIHESFLPGKRK